MIIPLRWGPAVRLCECRSETLLLALIALGVLIYGGVGIVSLIKGANFLDYNVLSADPVAGQHLGILLVELGVGITVAAAMIAIFYSFAGRSDFADGDQK